MTEAERRLRALSAGARREGGLKALFLMGRCRMNVAANDPQPDALMEGLTSVATVAALAGCRTEILDCRRHYGPGPALEAAASADLVFFPVYLSQLGFFSGFCSEAARRFPGKPLIAGGPLPTALPEEIASRLGLSAVVVGEGELTTLELIEAFTAGGTEALRGVAGLFVPGAGTSPGREPVSDFASLPFPDYSLWGAGAFPLKPFTAGLSSVRGCAGSCSFCSKVMPGMRVKPLARFEAELAELKSRFGAGAVLLNDPHLNRGGSAAELCGVFGRAGVAYFCFLRVTDVTAELAARLKATGCYGVYLGLESYNEGLLKGINKYSGPARRMDEAVELLAAAGLRTVCGIIFGLPGETRETLENTLGFIRRHHFLPDMHYLTLDPGSPLFLRARETGAINDPLAYLLAMENDEPAHMEATARVTGVPGALVAEYLSKACLIKEERLRRYAASLAAPAATFCRAAAW